MVNVWRPAPVATLLAILTLIGGCASLGQSSTEVTIREPGNRRLGPPQPIAPRATEDLEFAWLSDAAYGNTPAGYAKHSEVDALAKSAKVSDPAVDAATACRSSQDELFDRGWAPWPSFPSGDLLAHIERYHLRVEVWTHNDPPMVAVAFGGTVVNNQNDWAANLRWFLPKWFLAGHPDEYSTVVQEFGPAFVSEFRHQLESTDPTWAFLRQATIYSTGHSLGGGLAQQFAYALPQDEKVPRVRKVYAFDPSPVTGYYSVDEYDRETNSQSLAIDRIYERGEILALVRSLTSFFVTPKASSPTITGVRYALFYPATPVGGHSIKHLSCRLKDVAQSRP